VQALLAASSPEGRRPIVLAATAGLRRGEVFGLCWQDVDFEKRVIRVRASNANGRLTRPKTEAGERLVPMFGSVRLAPARAASAVPLHPPTRRRVPERRRAP
jgi:integrase